MMYSSVLKDLWKTNTAHVVHSFALNVEISKSKIKREKHRVNTSNAIAVSPNTHHGSFSEVSLS